MLAYNHPGQLVSVTVGGVPQGSYLYDYLSRLVSRSLPAATLHLVHDLDGNVIAEYDASGALNREYVWLEDRPVAAGERLVADHGPEQGFDLWLAERLRQAGRHLRRLDPGAGVALGPPLLREEAVQRPHRDDGPRHGGGREVAAPQVGDVRLDVGLGGVGKRRAAPGRRTIPSAPLSSLLR